MGYGIKTTLAISAQQSAGTATSSFEFVKLVSESLTDNIEQLKEESLRGRYEEGPTHVGLNYVEGDFTFEADPLMLGHFLRGVVGNISGTLTTSHYVWTAVGSQEDFDTFSALPPYTVKVHRDVGSTHLFTDCIFTALTLELGGNSILRGTVSVMGKISSLTTATAATYNTVNPLLWSATSVSIAGTANADMESLTITWENNIEGVDLLDATNRYSKFKRTTWRTLNVSGVLNYDAQTEFNKFISQSEQQFIVNISGDAATSSGTNQALKLDVPSLRYTTFPVPAAGPGRLSVSWEGDAKYNTGSANFGTFTLTNNRANYAV